MGQPENPPPYPAQQPQQFQQEQPHQTDRGAPGQGHNQKRSNNQQKGKLKQLGSKMMDSMVRGFGWGIGSALSRSLMNALCGGNNR